MDKKKEINVSATTAIELKAELAQHVEQFEKIRSSSGKQVTAKRPDKKPTVWSKQNKGVDERNQRDKVRQLSAVESDVLTRSREQLEKKAKLYEAMQSGAYQVDLDQDEENQLLVNFDKKYFQEREREKRRDSDKKSNKRRRSDDEKEDPWVEYEDEFGRTRIVRQSEVPQIAALSSDDESEEDERKTEHYQGPSEESMIAADRSDMTHYEAEREIRTKGVGFYGFSKDEDERREQMNKLNKMREETQNARRAAIDSATKRKQMLSQNAERIRAKKAALQAKRHHQLKPEQVPRDVSIPSVVSEDSVTDFLKSIRKQVE